MPKGADAVFVCTLDEQHAEIVVGLAPLNLHILCEKPLATRLDDCLDIYSSLLPAGIDTAPQTLFSIGHVLRYTPHNMLLRDLLLKERIIGDILSIEHTEPVGWRHFAHSYVRGNWRKESATAPSLLTKSCHDIDLLLWLLCSPANAHTNIPPHQPSHISSLGHLHTFKRSRKPVQAGKATNCLKCLVEPSCMYSAKKMYVEGQLKKGHTGWPATIVNPAVEECYIKQGQEAAVQLLLGSLAEDYDAQRMPAAEIDARPWFGRCVWESANDVCDDQVVTISWEDDPIEGMPSHNRNSKTAVFHMIANTEAQCQRRGRIYGTKGEIVYDGAKIEVLDFASGEHKLHVPSPPRAKDAHGGGDSGLAFNFIEAVEAVKNGEHSVNWAQREFIGCTLEDIIRSHAMVFAAEEARTSKKVVDWREWWRDNVQERVRTSEWIPV